MKLWGAPVALACLFSRPVSADPPPAQSQCLAAFEQVQNARKRADLLAAEDATLACGQGQCPAVVRSKCIEWRAEIQAQIPSIVVTAIDADGHDAREGKVSIDGKLVRKQLDGQAIRLNPGRHQVQVEYAGETRDQQVVLAEGQRKREVSFHFDPAPSQGTPSQGTELSPLLFVGIAVGGAGRVAGIVGGVLALDAASTFDAQCPMGNACPEPARATYDEGLVAAHVSTVGFALAGAGLALIGVGLLTSDWGGAPVEVGIGFGGLFARGRF